MRFIVQWASVRGDHEDRDASKHSAKNEYAVPNAVVMPELGIKHLSPRTNRHTKPLPPRACRPTGIRRSVRDHWREVWPKNKVVGYAINWFFCKSDRPIKRCESTQQWKIKELTQIESIAVAVSCHELYSDGTERSGGPNCRWKSKGLRRFRVLLARRPVERR